MDDKDTALEHSVAKRKELEHRDEFARAALTGIMSNRDNRVTDNKTGEILSPFSPKGVSSIVIIAYRFADECMKQRVL